MVDAAVATDPRTPDHLFDTGLCVDVGCAQIAAGVRPFLPRWTLWTDGAEKQRWIWLPPGKKIDNSDPNHWRFPVGTKLWKAFSVGGKRLETRYMVKLDTGDNHWFMVAYAWNTAQNDAVAVPRGIENAAGTNHDIPSRSDCRQCHDRLPAGVLGFSALALDYSAPATMLDLEDLASEGLLVAALPGSGAPRYPLPTGRNSSEQQYAGDAVGYLHMNCGHCHNPDSPVADAVPLQLRLMTNTLSSWPATNVYATAVGVDATAAIDGATVLVKPQDPNGSVVITRMNNSNPAIHMPALGSEVVDATAQTLLRNWINSLPTN